MNIWSCNKVNHSQLLRVTCTLVYRGVHKVEVSGTGFVYSLLDI